MDRLLWLGRVQKLIYLEVSASVSVVIFGPNLWGKRPALIRSGSGWSAIENGRTATFLTPHAAGTPETPIHSSRRKLQNPSKDQKLLIPLLQCRKFIRTHRTPASKPKDY
jgi:hypothetical protein